MKRPFRPLRLLTALLCAALLQLTGCSWFFMPGPVIITDSFPAETAPETALDTASDTAAETDPETSSGTAEVSPSASSSSAPAEESTPGESDSAESTAAESEPGEGTSAETEPGGSAEDPGTAAESAVPKTTADSTEAPEAFTVDYFRTPEFLRSVASDAVIVDAYNLISACISYNNTARVNCAKEDVGRVLYVADTLCPLLKAFTDISEESFADGEMLWNFYVDKVEFAILRAEFEAQVAAYFEPLAAAGPGLSETERALLLYHAYTEPASYNYEIISGAFKSRTEAEKHRIHSAYAGIVDHTGVCHDLAGGMTFLFIQGGFNACRVSVFTKDEHSWTLIELDGRNTFCDATWDVGGSFSFFGNSADERTLKTGGSYRLKDMIVYDLNVPEAFDVVNPGFGPLQDFSHRLGIGTCLFFSIDTEARPHRLIFTAPSGARLELDCP